MSAKSTIAAGTRASRRRLLLPLALTQFIASFAGSNMNVAINSISKDLDTTIHGVVADLTSPNKNAPYIAAMAALAGISLIGLAAAILLPSGPEPQASAG
jgi:membrane protein YqaA with SNARE-associated domain